MDYYKTLGVDRNASPEEIKKAYRKLAAKNHPDRGGSTEEFQKIEEAYRNLSDPNLKSQHDNPNPFGAQAGGGFHGGFPGSFAFNFGGGNPFEDIFSQFTRQQRQKVYAVTLWVTLEQVAKGTEEDIQLAMADGVKTFKIKIPKSVEDGQHIRYENLMPDGSLQIEFRVHRHAVFERRGLDLYLTKKISIYDLILGTTIKIKTIHGDELELTVPSRTNPGTTLRIHHRGLTATNGTIGDLYVLTSATIPDKISDELLSLITQERSTQF